MRRFVLLLAALIVATQTGAARIVLIYPRAMHDGAPFRYAASVDSTFLIGRVEGTSGRLLINDQPASMWPSGAFMAWLPLRKSEDERRWELKHYVNDRVEDSLEFRYEIGDVDGRDGGDTLTHMSFPRVLRVAVPHAHTLTTVGGSYHLFPDSGCRLLARGYADRSFLLDLGGGFSGAIPADFVHVEADSQLPDAMIGNGSCIQSGFDTRCAFAVSRVVPWAVRSAADEKSLTVTLLGTHAAIDRIRYDRSDPLLSQIVWSQLPCGVDIEFRCRAPLNNGCDVSFEHDSLVVRLRGYDASRKGLKGKTIVVDAGHGGEADGTIGPLGTREKDITLKWAQLLKAELIKQGAVVKLTRDTDRSVDLYERIDDAREWSADFFLSLHANALPDGENPFVRHGTGTYYYQSTARTAAEILHRHALAAGGLRDDGLYYASLAVIRPTLFPAVLIEAAYLIYPPEEDLLRSEIFLRKLSRALVDGLREYYGIRR